MDYLLIVAEFSWFSPASWWAIAQVIIGLGLVIFVHELGHFLVAKACGVKCEKFYVGFDAFDIKIGDRVIVPRALVKWQWGETEYGVGIVPLGGYVKMLGQTDNPGDTAEEIKRSMIEAGVEVDDEAIAAGVYDKEKMDPRSYLAKSVIQRMAIISAGVVFNLIFAVFFAAIAFRAGVDYTPPIIGNVTPGGPAWTADMTGASVLKVGDKKTTDTYFTFIDLAQEVALNGDQQPLNIEVQRPQDSEPIALSLTPKKGMRRDADFALLGLVPSLRPRLNSTTPVATGHAGEKAHPPLMAGDLITKINGQEIITAYDVLKAITQNRDREIEMTVERVDPNTKKDAEENPTTITVVSKIPPNPAHELGMVMNWLPVAGVQQNSPAASADGFKIGDEIVAIDGDARGDLLTLEQRMTVIARDNPRPVKFEVLRDGKKTEIEIVPRLPRVIPSNSDNHPIGIDSLGVAIGLSRTVESIIPGSPASNVDIQKGDVVGSVEFFLNKEQKKDYKEIAKTPVVKMKQSKFEYGWTEIWNPVQVLPIGSKFKLTMLRFNNAADRSDESKAKEVVVELKSVASKTATQHTRGILLSQLQHNYRSYSWADAIPLGARQTWFETKRVGSFLLKLITGKISATNLGGPGTIAMVATSEASQGTSRLLLFLTLLSANLAIVNFLPIPVLDGGHMLFLLYEGIFRKPVTERVQILLTYLGLFFILGLMGFVLLLDFWRFITIY